MYKFYTSKNVKQKTASTASNDPLQEHLNDIVTQVTIPNANQQGPTNREDWDSITLIDDDEDRLQAITPSQNIADTDPTTDTATLQVSSGSVSVNNSQLSIAERQLAELTAGSKRRKGKGLKNNGSSKK